MKKLLALVFMLLTLPAFAQEDSMPAYLLIRLVQRGDTTDPLNNIPGYPTTAEAFNQYGGKQVLPKYGQIVITDATVAEVRNYCVPWNREIDFDILSQDLASDTFTLKAFVKPEFVSQSGVNSLTREQVENYLTKWNATVQSIAANSVTFTAVIAEVIGSNGFWDMDVSGGIFNELAYLPATGLHTIRLTYSGIPGANQNNVAARIVERGCTVTANNPAQSRMTFTCNRQTVYNQFKADVKAKTDGMFTRRKWRVTQSAIDAIIAAGGSLELTRDQVLDFWRSMLSD